MEGRFGGDGCDWYAEYDPGPALQFQTLGRRRTAPSRATSGRTPGETGAWPVKKVETKVKTSFEDGQKTNCPVACNHLHGEGALDGGCVSLFRRRPRGRSSRAMCTTSSRSLIPGRRAPAPTARRGRTPGETGATGTRRILGVPSYGIWAEDHHVPVAHHRSRLAREGAHRTRGLKSSAVVRSYFSDGSSSSVTAAVLSGYNVRVAFQPPPSAAASTPATA